MKAVMFVLSLVVGSVSAADDLVMRVKLTQPLVTGNSADAQSAPEGLTGAGISIGLGEATLHGSVSHEQLPDTSTRETINWHSVSMPAGTTRASEQLTAPLVSQFAVTDERVEPGTVLNVRGNLDYLAEAIERLKSKAQAGANPKHLVSNTDKETLNQMQGAGSLSPGSGGRTMGGNNMPLPLSTNNSKIATNLITSAWEACAPRIDKGDWKVYEQFKKVEKAQDGATVSSGACIDQGAVVDIVKDYASCPVVADQHTLKAHQQYKTFTTLNGQKLDVADCKVDAEAFYPIESTAVGCGVRHDFVAKKSIQQKKLFYKDSLSATVPVADCQDSELAYAQYTTANTCTPTFDAGQNIMIGSSRVTYKDAAGTEQYAAECRPDETTFPVMEAYCDPKYDHDFGAGQSYYYTRSYYTNPEGKPVYLTACARSTKTSFPHVYQSASCGVVNDDAKLMTTWKSKTQITTPDDGMMEIAPCQQRGSPTPYAYTGEDRKVWSNFESLGLKGIGSTVYFGSMRENIHWANFTNALNTYRVVCTFGGGIDGNTVTACNSADLNYSNRISGNTTTYIGRNRSTEEFRRTYLRGDGTSYVEQNVYRNNIILRLCWAGYQNGTGGRTAANCPAYFN
ncbi:hypothetical protein [Nitrosovibrio sp. Nv6]|uniref:hypothetical protein n=1 Tax=Nitrosovibrio sp. Nv6 TaxID=1855340 RepID=UPI0008AD9F08|nr:hypothetical protein [Nitrosovibrio sp. Nv6]SEP43182.1 hypothetical protein SAMN05216316_3091 [Nitrosovibrio sp. Nv6]